MKHLSVALALAGLLAACGSSPTAPSKPAPAPSTTVPSVQPPADPPSPPETPPTDPVLPPAPPAPPAAQPTLTLDATTTSGHWYDPAKALPTTFTITVWPDHTVRLGNQSFPIAVQTPDSILVEIREVATFNAVRVTGGVWEWDFNGVAGQAFGTAVTR